MIANYNCFRNNPFKNHIMTKKVPFYLLYFFFFVGLLGYSQISKPTFLFSKTCGSSTFNTFSVTYNFSGTPAPTNQFSIE